MRLHARLQSFRSVALELSDTAGAQFNAWPITSFFTDKSVTGEYA